MSATADEIVPRLSQLLPPGRALAAQSTSVLYQFLGASAEELSRIYSRVQDALDEGHPATASETLSDWEVEYGLPEPGYPAPASIDDRRAAVATKAFYALGGQSRGYYIQVAAGLGITITIQEPRPFWVGICGCGDDVGGVEWQFRWFVHCSPGTTNSLQPIFERIRPAHTEVFFLEDL